MGWQLMVVAPNTEVTVQKVLDALEIKNHVFRFRKKLAHRGRIIERTSPLFPGYVFVHPQHKLDLVRCISKVLAFVRKGDARYGEIAEVSDSVVYSFLQEADADGVLPLAEESNPENWKFKPGEIVRIKDGPASGYKATFQHPMMDGRAIVLIDWMGRWVPVNVYEADIESGTKKEENRSWRRKRYGRARRKREHRRNIAMAAPD